MILNVAQVVMACCLGVAAAGCRCTPTQNSLPRSGIADVDLRLLCIPFPREDESRFAYVVINCGTAPVMISDNISFIWEFESSDGIGGFVGYWPESTPPHPLQPHFVVLPIWHGEMRKWVNAEAETCFRGVVKMKDSIGTRKGSLLLDAYVHVLDGLTEEGGPITWEVRISCKRSTPTTKTVVLDPNQ